MSSHHDSLSLSNYPYRSRRLPVFAQKGVVATSQPLAAQSGLSILEQGGNAVDAAIATAICLTVVEPTCNGMGGDAVALVWDGETMHGLNGTGHSSQAQTLELFRGKELQRVPSRGWLPVTVPGGPRAWESLHSRLGRLPWESLFAPAIRYATEGFPVSPVTAQRWRLAAQTYASSPVTDPALEEWGRVFTRKGEPPRAGEVWKLPALAQTLKTLASEGADAFYKGVLARRILDFSRETGGHLTAEDLSQHESSWVEPIHGRYRDHEIWGLPPSSQGIAALLALRILDGYDFSKLPRESSDSYHLQIEATKLALAQTFSSVTDPRFLKFSPTDWLKDEYIEACRAKIGTTAREPAPEQSPGGGTVYLSTADADGMMVSFMQSNYSGWLLGFGSGVVVPGTGIALHARGAGFSLDPKHPNCIAPQKRPFHTLAPAFLCKQGQPVGPFGIMGGPVQTQAQVQFLVNQVDYGMNPQACIDAPRFQWLSGNRVEVESSVPSHVIQNLLERGHDIETCVEFAAVPPRLKGALSGPSSTFSSGDFGKAQAIVRLDNGIYCAGSDWRSDGCAVGY